MPDPFQKLDRQFAGSGKIDLPDASPSQIFLGEYNLSTLYARRGRQNRSGCDWFMTSTENRDLGALRPSTTVGRQRGGTFAENAASTTGTHQQGHSQYCSARELNGSQIGTSREKSGTSRRHPDAKTDRDDRRKGPFRKRAPALFSGTAQHRARRCKFDGRQYPVDPWRCWSLSMWPANSSTPAQPSLSKQIISNVRFVGRRPVYHMIRMQAIKAASIGISTPEMGT
jgi:hypothetical protein